MLVNKRFLVLACNKNPFHSLNWPYCNFQFCPHCFRTKPPFTKQMLYLEKSLCNLRLILSKPLFKSPYGAIYHPSRSSLFTFNKHKSSFSNSLIMLVTCAINPDVIHLLPTTVRHIMWDSEHGVKNTSHSTCFLLKSCFIHHKSLLEWIVEKCWGTMANVFPTWKPTQPIQVGLRRTWFPTSGDSRQILCFLKACWNCGLVSRF